MTVSFPVLQTLGPESRQPAQLQMRRDGVAHDGWWRSGIAGARSFDAKHAVAGSDRSGEPGSSESAGNSGSTRDRTRCECRIAPTREAPRRTRTCGAQTGSRGTRDATRTIGAIRCAVLRTTRPAGPPGTCALLQQLLAVGYEHQRRSAELLGLLRDVHRVGPKPDRVRNCTPGMSYPGAMLASGRGAVREHCAL